MNYSSSLNLNRAFFTTLTLSKSGEDNIISYDHYIFFNDGIAISNPAPKIIFNKVEGDRTNICNSIQYASDSELKWLYKTGAWGLYKISNDTLTMQVFNGNMRMMLSDFYSLSTYTFQIVSKDSLKFLKLEHYEDKAGWKVKTAQVTSIDCLHNLTSDKAWIKREKWLYCNNK